MENTKSASKKPAKKSWRKGIASEFKKIIWPTKATVAKQTTAVVIVTVILGSVIVVIDMIIQMLLNLIV